MARRKSAGSERRRGGDALPFAHDAHQLPDEPGVDAGPGHGLVDPDAAAQRRLELEDPFGRGDSHALDELLERELVQRRLGRVGVEPGPALLQ